MSTFLSILPIIIALVLYFTGIPIAYALFAAALTGKNRLSAKKMNFFPSAFYSH